MSRVRLAGVGPLTLALAISLMCLVPQPATAEPSNKPLVTGRLVADGPIDAVVHVGNTLHLGGRFNRFGISSGPFVRVSAITSATIPLVDPLRTGTTNVVIPDGSGGWYVGGHELRMDDANPFPEVLHYLSDGSRDPGFAGPEIAGVVTDLLLDNGSLYIAGDFITVNGQSRRSLIEVDAATGALQPFEPSIEGAVYAIEKSASTLYVGGNFATAGGAARANIAAFDLVTNALTQWNPGVTGEVRALQLESLYIYVGGTFTAAGGAPRHNLAQLNTTLNSNSATPWDPQPNDTVLAIAVSGNSLIVGGEFTLISGLPRFFVADYSVSTGTLMAWTPNPNGVVRTLEPSVGGASVYVGGDFEAIANTTRAFAAEVSLVDGSLTLWNPGPLASVRGIAAEGTAVALVGAFGGVGAQLRRGLAAIDPDTGQLKPWTAFVGGGNVRTLAVGPGDLIYIGGDFGSINMTPRLGLAAMHTDGSLDSWNPGADGPVNALAVMSGRVFAGGAFANAGGVAALNLVALTPDTGVPAAPAIDASGEVHTLVIADDDGRLYVGGAFDTLLGVPRANVGALETSALAVTLSTWAPSANGPVYAMQESGSVYIGGSFSEVNGQPRGNVASLSASDATLVPGFSPTTDGVVRALKAIRNTLYLGGQFTAVNGVPRYGLADVNALSGQLRLWTARTEQTRYAKLFIPWLSGLTGLWVMGTYDTIEFEPLQGMSFFPDLAPWLAPIANQTVPEDQSITLPLDATDELLPPSLFNFTVSSTDHTIVDPTGLSLSFNANTWTLSIAPKSNATGTTTITVAMHDGLMLAPVRQFTLTVTPVSDQPVITGLSDAAIVKDTVFTRGFTVTDIDNSPNTINLFHSSSNAALVPNGNVVVDGADADKIITVTPLAGQTGTAIITVTVNDGVSGDVSVSFTLTVVAGNAAPTITPMANQTTTIGVPVGPLSFTVADDDGGALTVTASSSNITAVPQANLTLAGADANRTMTITPAPGQAGVTTITVSVTDGIATTSTSFQLTVNGLPPGPPQNLQAAVNATQVTLTWQAPDSGGLPTGYVLEGGTTPGGSDLPTTPVGLVTSYVATLPAGTYFVRMRATNGFGLSAPSNEVTVVINSGLPAVPGAPTGLVSGLAGNLLILYWMAPITGGVPTSYVLEAGSAIGQADLAVLPLASAATGVQIPGVPNGVFYLRVRAANAVGVGPASNETAVTVGAPAACVSAPSAPIALTPTVQGALVTLSWMPGAGSAPTSYRVRVGSAPDIVDIAEIPIGSVLTSLMATAPPGTYYVHFVGVNNCGVSTPSNEVSLTVQGGQAPPGPVTGLTWTLGPNNTLTLQWQPAAGDVTSYLLVAGSSSGASDLAVVPTGSTATALSVSNAGSGTYYVRVHALNGAGHGEASNEIVIVIP